MKYIKNVVTLELDQDKCIGCSMCTAVCPHAVFEMETKKASITLKDSCMECGACAKNCPVNAISVKAGVGCATGIINGVMSGGEPSCDCSCESNKTCC
jgi:NAD-dependent dihydropyrimidine dehydrogenase PreA subunit